MTNIIYTIGYAGFSVEEFIEKLIVHEINIVIDVRSKPFSKHNQEYNKNIIPHTLNKFKIKYFSYADEFGARQVNQEFYCESGYMDFDKFSESIQFMNGINNLIEGMKENNTYVLMCAEKDPIKCHRAVLIARKFYELGFNVIHIMPNFDITHYDLELRLIDTYFPDRMQGNIFTGFMSDYECLRESYRKCNAEIGWRIEKE